jgi:hypothetical protein
MTESTTEQGDTTASQQLVVSPFPEMADSSAAGGNSNECVH